MSNEKDTCHVMCICPCGGGLHRCARGAKFYTGQYDFGDNPDGHYK